MLDRFSPLVGPYGPTTYIRTADQNVYLAFDWNPDESQYNRNARKVRREDVPSLAMQTAERTSPNS